MKKLMLIVLMFPIIASAQEMQFVIEKLCLSTGEGIDFKCRSESQKFTLLRDGNKFTGINRNGESQRLTVLESTPNITVLNIPVAYDGISTLTLTSSFNEFYWVEISYSTVFNQRSVSVQSGRRLR